MAKATHSNDAVPLALGVGVLRITDAPFGKVSEANPNVLAPPSTARMFHVVKQSRLIASRTLRACAPTQLQEREVSARARCAARKALRNFDVSDLLFGLSSPFPTNDREAY
jgi:hypothetical protein